MTYFLDKPKILSKSKIQVCSITKETTRNLEDSTLSLLREPSSSHLIFPWSDPHYYLSYMVLAGKPPILESQDWPMGSDPVSLSLSAYLPVCLFVEMSSRSPG